MICPQCGKNLGDSDRFCAYCGYSLPSPRSAAPGQGGFIPQQTGSFVPTQSSMPAGGQSYPPQYSAYSAYSDPATGTVTGAYGSQYPAKAKGGSGLRTYLLTVFIGLVILGGGFALFIKPGYLAGKIGSDSSSSDGSSKAFSDSSAGSSSRGTSSRSSKLFGKSSSASDSGSENSFSAEENGAASQGGNESGSSKAEERPAVTTTTAAVTTREPEETRPAETKPAGTKPPVTTTTASQRSEEGPSDGDMAAYNEASYYSTYDRPSFDEFEWCFGQSGFIYDMPSYAAAITDPLGFTGGWKAMVIYNPTNSSGTFTRELDNISIGVYSGACDVTVDWYAIDYYGTGDLEYEDGMDDGLFLGDADSSGIRADYTYGGAVLRLYRFWKEDGGQYALGSIDLEDGTSAYVAMKRP